MEHATKRCGFVVLSFFLCVSFCCLLCTQPSSVVVSLHLWCARVCRNTGNYNSQPGSTNFFRDFGGYTSDYGQFFLSWYGGALLAHGDKIMGAAREVFGQDTNLSGTRACLLCFPVVQRLNFMWFQLKSPVSIGGTVHSRTLLKRPPGTLIRSTVMDTQMYVLSVCERSAVRTHDLLCRLHRC